MSLANGSLGGADAAVVDAGAAAVAAGAPAAAVAAAVVAAAGSGVVAAFAKTHTTFKVSSTIKSPSQHCAAGQGSTVLACPPNGGN